MFSYEGKQGGGGTRGNAPAPNKHSHLAQVFVCGEAQTIEQSMLLLFLFLLGGLLWFSIFFKILKSL